MKRETVGSDAKGMSVSGAGAVAAEDPRETGARSRKLIYLVVAAFAAVLVGWVFYSTMKIPAPKLNSEAPAFSLSDVNGNRVSLADLRGKPVLINMWATWCPACKSEMPDLAKFYNDNKDKVTVVAIDMQEDPTTVSNYLRDNNLNIPVLLDPDGVVGNLYKVDSIPASFFIDKDGVVKNIKIGAMSASEIQYRIASLY